jgi:hypothetical protein
MLTNWHVCKNFTRKHIVIKPITDTKNAIFLIAKQSNDTVHNRLQATEEFESTAMFSYHVSHSKRKFKNSCLKLYKKVLFYASVSKNPTQQNSHRSTQKQASNSYLQTQNIPSHFTYCISKNSPVTE